MKLKTDNPLLMMFVACVVSVACADAALQKPGDDTITISVSSRPYRGLSDEGTETDISGVGHEGYAEAEESVFLPVVMDFSRVGYHWGEEVPVSCPAGTILYPADGDRTSDIQNAIDKTDAGHAVLLKEGTYEVGGQIVMKTGVVLRGEGADRTVILATGTSRYVDPDASKPVDRTLITIGDAVRDNASFRASRYSDPSSEIIEDAAAGRFYVRVQEPDRFKAGDDVAVYRPGSAAWLNALKMDAITQNASGSVIQWTEDEYAYMYDLYWSRKVVRVSGDKIWLDNPLAMELNDDYGTSRGRLYTEKLDRVAECGIEELCLRSQYDAGETDFERNLIDEDHCWSAIDVNAAEHCWIRNVTAQHFGFCMVNLRLGARYITVSDCRSEAPVSTVTGSRRYAFHNYKGELSLFTGCTAEQDRHGCVTGVRTAGPNVFHRCTMTDALSDMGPHQRWATGVLYDSCVTDGLLGVQDRGNWGTGQGWAGVNFLLWNCEAASMTVQSPWTSGKNWAIGCIGTKVPGKEDGRPDGEWLSHGIHVAPASLYEHQLADRLNNGNQLSKLLK